VPLNFTAVAPVKLAPVTVTLVPIGPVVGEKLVIDGGGITVKLVALLAEPPAVVTLMVPVVAPEGTVAVICVAELTVNVAVVPLKLTAVAPVKFAPVTITLVPAGPLAGEKLVIDGAGITVKLDALVAVPPAVVTLIVPLVALAGTVAVICVSELTVKLVALVALNFTALAPVKAVPVIVTLAPTPPLVGEKLVIEGATTVTVNEDALVAVPPAVVTLIVPVVAPTGTAAVICVEELTVKLLALVPLNFTADAPVKFAPAMVTLVPTVPLVGEKLLMLGAGVPPVALLRGFTVPVVKSAALLSVSVAPFPARKSEAVADGAGAAPVPSNASAVPYPTKSATFAAPAGLSTAKTVVVDVTATLPAVADIEIVPVASGVGRLVVPPVPAASCTK
jgi:hypothetical protein